MLNFRITTSYFKFSIEYLAHWKASNIHVISWRLIILTAAHSPDIYTMTLTFLTIYAALQHAIWEMKYEQFEHRIICMDVYYKTVGNFMLTLQRVCMHYSLMLKLYWYLEKLYVHVHVLDIILQICFEKFKIEIML